MNYYKVSSLSFLCALFILMGSCKKENLINNEKPPTILDSQLIYSDITYGRNIDWKGQKQDLQMDIYIPALKSTVSKKYPVLLFIHGGGFIGGDKKSARSFATTMNKKGFAVAAINYRLGWTKDSVNKCDNDTLQAAEAFYRALQDTRASLRFIAAYAEKYHLDTNWIFIGGSSAGGVASLNAAYYSPSIAKINFPDFDKKLGLLDAGNDLKNKYTIQAIANMWGALTDLNIITKENAKPTISFHGMMDNIVPYDVGHIYSCEIMQIGYGSKPIYGRLTGFGISAVAHIDPLGGHGVYDETFRTNNIACFLNGVINNTKQTGYYYNLEGDCGGN